MYKQKHNKYICVNNSNSNHWILYHCFTYEENVKIFVLKKKIIKYSKYWLLSSFRTMQHKKLATLGAMLLIKNVLGKLIFLSYKWQM